MTLKKTRFTTDGYKLSVGQVFWRWNMLYNMKVEGRYMFVDRDNRYYPSGFAERLREKFEENADLPAHQEIANYLGYRYPFLLGDYINWYNRVFYFDPSQIDLSQKDGKLRIFYEGPIHTVAHHEIISLFDISNLITETFGYKPKYGWQDEVHHDAKVLKEKGVTHSHGGGRRALSRVHHDEVLGILAQYKKDLESPGGFYGESFIDMAWEHNLPIMGTMGHEYPMACSGIWGVRDANKKAREIWHQEYGRNLGYWLDDTWGSDFSDAEITAEEVARLSGFRQDSQKFEKYVDDKIALLERLKVDNSKKQIIASEGLKTLKDIIKVVEYRPGNFNRAALLGKKWSNNSCYTGNDRFGKPSMGYNIVNKLVSVRVNGGKWHDVCKLSDDMSKAIGSQSAIDEANEARRQVLGAA